MKHLFAWGIASILAFMTIGCGHSIEQELGTTDLATPHVYTNPTGDEFPILAWYSLLGDQVTKERYEEMAEAGFNISFSHFGTIEQVEQALELSQGTGVKILITCGEMYNDTENTVKHFRHHPQNAGYFLRDEPAGADFPALAELAENIRKADDTKLLYLNLFPNYVPAEHLGAASYADHVAQFIKDVKLGMVSFDHYPVIDTGVRRNHFYANLEDVAAESKKAGIPFWAFSLSTAHTPYPVATRGAMRLQIFTNLAYGAQGIQYFTYTNPGTETWNFHNAPIDTNSQRTEVWDRVAEINHEVQTLKGVFLGAEMIKVRHTGENLPAHTTALAEGDLPAQISKVEADGEGVVVSQLKNGTMRYLMVVNRDIYQPQRVTVECAEEVMRYLPTGKVVAASTYSPSLYVEPGDMLLFGWQETK
ncbi:MAG: beta-galactosidase [Alistipes sp.]|nr:beta-galactosidase [Alistipes sp.]